jgi:F-type H+-transporting ATPase subunit gamma
MLRVLNSLATRVEQQTHPLLDTRETKRAGGKVMLIVITGDRGLCGSFNSNVIKQAGGFVVADPDREVALGLVGRRGRDFFARRGFEVLYQHVNLFGKLRYEDAQDVAETAIDTFVGGQVDAIYLVYNEFKSVMQQRVVIERVLPIAKLVEDEDEDDGGEAEIDYLYEPDPQQIFDALLPRHVEVQIYRALLESNAAFFAAQMAAMDTATKNAAEMIDTLTLYMNKVRQAAITREIIEVVSGAQEQ